MKERFIYDFHVLAETECLWRHSQDVTLGTEEKRNQWESGYCARLEVLWG